MNDDLITEIRSSKGAPLFGFWYPACSSADLVPRSMKGTVLLGLPILVSKNSTGDVAAMRDLCPHRGMPLSFGRMRGDCIECAYHGWRFDHKGRCQGIPALIEGSPIQTDKIGVTTYPCRERDGYVWVFIPDPLRSEQAIPDIPPLPLPSSRYRMIQISTVLNAAIDDGILGLVDPLHGPFVHQSSWWRTQASMHEKAKTFEPIPAGFRMVPHPPSKNSGPYKILKMFYGGPLTTTIDFILPNQRFEFVQCGSMFVSMRAMITPLTDQQCRMDFSAAWNAPGWMPFSKTLFRYFAKIFLQQDKQAMERQAVGLRYKPALMFLDDADTPSKWYYKLKAAHLASVHTGQPLDHPLKGQVTLRWRS
jgi:phenylpropionate dioxygenase-like ring-hydroxylating dioxygenase large terminal subunit